MNKKRFQKTLYAGITQDVYDKIERLANQNNQTMAQVVRRLLKFSLEKIGDK